MLREVNDVQEAYIMSRCVVTKSTFMHLFPIFLHASIVCPKFHQSCTWGKFLTVESNHLCSILLSHDRTLEWRSTSRTSLPPDRDRRTCLRPTMPILGRGRGRRAGGPFQTPDRGPRCTLPSNLTLKHDLDPIRFDFNLTWFRTSWGKD